MPVSVSSSKTSDSTKAPAKTGSKENAGKSVSRRQIKLNQSLTPTNNNYFIYGGKSSRACTPKQWRAQVGTGVKKK